MIAEDARAERKDSEDRGEVGTYRVAEGTQVNVDGIVHHAGEVLEADTATAMPWLVAGLITTVDPADDKPDKRYRRPK